MLLSRHTKRRAFIAGIGGAAASPLTARAQQQKMPVIGFLNPASLDVRGDLIAAFKSLFSATQLIPILVCSKQENCRLRSLLSGYTSCF
jgi:hypothetical protein